jgi:hypothetical protein
MDAQPLYLALCRQCHGADARGYAADHAPSLIYPTFLESATDGFLRRSQRNNYTCNGEFRMLRNWRFAMHTPCADAHNVPHVESRSSRVPAGPDTRN